MHNRTYGEKERRVEQAGPTRTRSLTGWGYADSAVTEEETALLQSLVSARFPDADVVRRQAGVFDAGAIPRSRLDVPDPLTAIVDVSPILRAHHALGRSYVDAVRAFNADFSSAPDAVAVPRDEHEVAAVLDWCAEQGAAVIPFGGGTSVVGGVTPPRDAGPVVTLQLRAMDKVLQVDETSLAVRVEAGATGPRLEEQLRPHGLTSRFFPQSFELSTVGGWIATRAGGHYATRLTHIDDLVEQIDAVAPAGAWSSRRLPASGAGPSPDRLLLGSEGTLGVVTSAWLRVQRRPIHKAGAAVRFPSFVAGAEGVRALAQSGLDPANARLLDPTEALLNGAGDGAAAVLVVGFESARVPVDADLAAALELCRDLGGEPDEPSRGTRDDAAASWRSAFLRAPYLRDGLIGLGVLSETFETAVTWDRFVDLCSAVLDTTAQAAAEVCGDAVVTCRITHAYPDGAAPYFTVIAPARRGAEAAQWAEIKAAASEAILAGGATITHHHAVGRDHRPWYDRQRPPLFAEMLDAAKHTLDPAGMLNPGVLLR